MKVVNKYGNVVRDKNPHELKLILVSITIFLLLLSLLNNLILEDSLNFFSFMVIHFLGYLFFLLIPVEGLFIYYLFEGYNAFILIILAITTALLAQAVDYIIGRLASDKIQILIKPKRYRFVRYYLEKYGFVIIFFFNLLLLSSPIVALIAGIIKMDYRKVFIYSFLGLSLKYLVIAIIFYLV